MTHPALDVYDVAFLAGGTDRVVDTAVVALVRSGRLRVHSPGQVATADPSCRHPVEAAVVHAVGPVGHQSVDTIRWRLVGDDRLLDVGRRLHHAGLLGRLGALGARSGARRGLVPTRAGRRTLHEHAERSSGDETMRVALGGREAMVDAGLRAAVFEPPDTTPPRLPRRRGGSRDEQIHDHRLAADRARAQGIAGVGSRDGGLGEGDLGGL
jgi:hypothetical protein